ncbi:glycosyltransferase [Methylobacterium sp. BTF04]|uniref:glycosyltransferase n=1 Tax=Methylobacterium sp. BTF04 TaxID=2708300 RepID=UPI0013D516FA|nr:glycosyltransferase [Methylobacterium sp. BTF04]NEU14579.1 glycosyltransferase [Methylobacterium sp. BTF04]
MMNRPTISVVIPLYNHEKYIKETLSSVLAQTVRPDEIIVLDDGSSDGGWKIAEQVLSGVSGARVDRQYNQGAHNSINTAIAASRGDLVAVLNSDDSFLPWKIARCLELFHVCPTLDLVFGRVAIIDSDSHVVQQSETTNWLDRSIAFYDRTQHLALSILNENFVTTTSNMVFTRSLWERNGRFQDLRYCHDLDFLLASCRHGTVHFDRDVEHIHYRVHPTNTIKEMLEKVQLEIAAVLASALDCRTLGLGVALTPQEQQLLEEIIHAKGLGAKITSLVPFCKSFDERGVLYRQISGNRKPHFRVANDQLAPAVQPVASRPFRVAIELSAFDRGGLEKVVLDCAVDFKRCGVEPLIISCGRVGHLANIARTHEIETIELPEENREDFYERLLRDRPVDIAMSHFSNVGYPVFRRLGIPNITYIHNIYAMLRGEALDNFIANDAFVNRYISVSQLATDYAVDKLGIAAHKIDTIPNGLIFAEHQYRFENSLVASRADFGIAEDDYLFLNVASYNLHKAHYLMADAMRLILKKRSDIKILCVGNTIHPPHIDQLRTDLVNWGLDKHMLMPGYFEDVASFHKAADAFLLPSLIEGWSIAMNEAMFYEKPMILSRTGGAPQVIENNDTGIIVPNEYGDIGNLNSYVLDSIGYDRRRFETAPYLANAMTNFADNRESWKLKGKFARQKVLHKYGFSDVVQKYIQICRTVIRGSEVQK